MIDDTDILKKCACGKSYTRNAWAALDYAGQQTDGEYNYELRLCACGSSLAVVLGFDQHDPRASTYPDALYGVRRYPSDPSARGGRGSGAWD